MIDYTLTQLKLMSLLNDAPKPRIPDAVDARLLAAFQYVAHKKEAADKLGVDFIGGFITPSGEAFIMTNMDEVDTQALLPEDLK